MNKKMKWATYWWKHEVTHVIWKYTLCIQVRSHTDTRQTRLYIVHPASYSFHYLMQMETPNGLSKVANIYHNGNILGIQ